LALRGVDYFLSQEDVVLAIVLIDVASLELFLKRNTTFLRQTIIEGTIPLNLHWFSNDPLSHHLSLDRMVALFGKFMPLLIEEHDALPDSQAYCVIVSLLLRVYYEVIIDGSS
jgi:hypothetical protein